MLSLILILVFIFSLSAVLADGITNQDKAVKLNEYGILKGSDQGFQLDKALSRVEGSVMLVRLLGKENEISNKSYTHPFTDVPKWADNYVGYLYTNGLTKGTSPTTFGTNDLMSASQYITFILRAIGYDDSKGDFAWNTSTDKAVEIGLITIDEKTALNKQSTFLRDDMVGLSYAALNTSMKNTKFTLYEKLVAEGAIVVEGEAVDGESKLVEKELSIEEKIANVKELSGDGFLFYLNPYWPGETRTTGLVYVIPSLLEDEVKDFAKISIPQYPIDFTKEEIFYDYFLKEEETMQFLTQNTNGIYNYNPLGMPKFMFTDQQWVVFLYDNKNNLIGYHIVKAEEYNSKNAEYLYDIKITLDDPVPNRVITSKDFTIKRIVNGVIDDKFHFSGSRTIRNEVILILREFVINNAEFEIESLHPDVKIKSIEKVPHQLQQIFY